MLQSSTGALNSHKRTMLRRYHYLYELDSSEVETDDLSMG